MNEGHNWNPSLFARAYFKASFDSHFFQGNSGYFALSAVARINVIGTLIRLLRPAPS
jgi:hypothetical protein